MTHVEVVHELSPATREGIDRFLRELSDHLHHGGRPGLECERLDDHLLADLRHGPRSGFLAALARRDGTLVGYAQASSSAGGHVVDSIIGPHEHDALRSDLLRPLMDALPAGSRVTWWAHDDDRDLAGSLGLVEGRRLLQMRVGLPVDEPGDILATRPFSVGADEANWLEVNNAAFAWHDEQGNWDLEMIRQREREPWFDPAGFLVHEVDGEMAGFCWTKLHPSASGADPRPIGEIYVIAVHPRHRGTGLGRALTLAGIDHLATVGARACMLYVDAANQPAVTLYASLGFRVVHAEQAFVGRHGRAGTVATQPALTRVPRRH
ncbi:MAG: mycothiol synthase [Ilumatobacteraceae bacterium]